MKVFVGTLTRAGHVNVDGPHHITSGTGTWYVYVPQTATDPITAVQLSPGPAMNPDKWQPVTHPVMDGETAFMPAFRAELSVRKGRVNLEVTTPEVRP